MTNTEFVKASDLLLQDTYTPLNWSARLSQHDALGYPLVQRYITRHNPYWSLASHGYENNQSLRDILNRSNDEISRKVRHQADAILWDTSRNVGRAYIEIVTENGGRPNFAVESLKFHAAKTEAELNPHIPYLIFLVDIKLELVYASDIRKMPDPHSIRIPRRGDEFESEKHLKEAFPEARTRFIDWTRGSGTPYHLVGKKKLHGIVLALRDLETKQSVLDISYIWPEKGKQITLFEGVWD